MHTRMVNSQRPPLLPEQRVHQHRGQNSDTDLTVNRGGGPDCGNQLLGGRKRPTVSLQRMMELRLKP